MTWYNSEERIIFFFQKSEEWGTLSKFIDWSTLNEYLKKIVEERSFKQEN